MKKVIILAIVLCTIVLHAAAQTEPSVTLIDPATADDDRVALAVRVEGVDPRQLAALSAANFTVSEPFTDLTVTSEPRLPMALHVIVNLSVNSEAALIQRTLKAYFDAYYRAGDDVTFTILAGRAPVTVEATNKVAIDALINGLATSEIYFSVAEVLPSVADALAEARAEDPDRVAMALFVGSFINNVSEVDAVAAFEDVGIPLHVVQAHTFRENFTEAMRQMAIRTGGIFVNNQAGALVVGEPPVAIGVLKVLFDAMQTSRLVFNVSYTSTSLELAAKPTVTLNVQTGPGATASLPFTYDRRFEPPVVEFANPSITASRRSSRADDGSPLFDNTELEIAVYVRFPDAVPRNIRSLQLQVLDELRGAVVQTQLLVDPQLAPDGSYRVRWSLNDYQSPGTITPVTIAVAVTDELGLTGRAEQASNVTVAALPPLPTPTPVPPTATFTPPPPTAVPTTVPPTAVPTAVASVAQTSNSVFMIGNMPISTTRLINGLGIIAVSLAGIAAALLLRIRRIRRQLRAANAAPNPSYMDMPTPLPEDGAPAMGNGNGAGEPEERRVLGRLIVKRGLPSQEIPVDAKEFVVGRTAGDGIHLAIDAPFISPRHCMITYRSNRFLIRDLGSKNGTFVNGERILPERDTIVPNGSEVEITRQIVFELWDPHTVVNVDYHMDDARTERMNSTSIRSSTVVDSVSFPSALGIRAAEDDDSEIGDDYSPV